MTALCTQRQLDPVRDRHFISFSASPHCIVTIDHDDGASTCLWQPALGRLDLVVRGGDEALVRECIAAAHEAAQFLEPRPKLLYVMAEEPLAQSLLRRLEAVEPIEQATLILTERPELSSPLGIRRLRVDDRSGIDAYADEHRSVRSLFFRHVEMPDDATVSLGVFDAGGLAGVCFAHATPPVPEVIYLHVLERYRARGFGAALLRAAAQWVLERSATLFYVTAAANSAALHTCESVGFRPHSSVLRSAVPIEIEDQQ